MTIRKTTLPAHSRLSSPDSAYDYVDSFRGNLPDQHHTLCAVDIGRAFFSSTPAWVEALFGVRNQLAGFFGLKTPGPGRPESYRHLRFDQGEQLGLFQVFDKTDNEIILGQDDRHLNFRVSLLLDQPQPQSPEKQLTISTTVVFHNWLGRLYFLPVRPFHQLIVPAMLKGIIRHLETKKQ